MATWTKDDLANNVLEFIGVKPMNQGAQGEHLEFVKDAIDSVYDQLQDPGLAPYGIETIPEWAQWPMTKYMAVEVGPRFGKPYPEGLKEIAKKEMAGSVFGAHRGVKPIRSQDF